MRTFRVSIGAAVGLALLLACGEASPPAPPETGAVDTLSPEPSAAPTPAPEPVSAPAPAPTPVEALPAPPAAPKPPPVVAKPAPPPPAPSPEPEPQVVPEPQPELALDLDGLERRLKETSALGVLTKLALKNEIDDLVDDVAKFHQKKRGELTVLRERFELLLMKLTSLLQYKEPELAREVAAAREGLWKLLADPGEFAKLSA